MVDFTFCKVSKSALHISIRYGDACNFFFALNFYLLILFLSPFYRMVLCVFLIRCILVTDYDGRWFYSHYWMHHFSSFWTCLHGSWNEFEKFSSYCLSANAISLFVQCFYQIFCAYLKQSLFYVMLFWYSFNFESKNYFPSDLFTFFPPFSF